MAALSRLMIICLLVFSCSTQESNVLQWPEKSVQQTPGSGGASVGIGQVTLVWEQSASTADAFEIYFSANSKNLKGASKVASLIAGSEVSQSYTVTPKQIQAAEAAAAVGNQKCFYVVAVSGGTLSDPSEAVCLSLAEQ
ncbi:MAG: hypothetical protein RI932_930 [Pseudomonadota bacterium]|jgi:hypothetical protein